MLRIVFKESAKDKSFGTIRDLDETVYSATEI